MEKKNRPGSFQQIQFRALQSRVSCRIHQQRSNCVEFTAEAINVSSGMFHVSALISTAVR
jgi:hypothetical protein